MSGRFYIANPGSDSDGESTRRQPNGSRHGPSTRVMGARSPNKPVGGQTSYHSKSIPPQPAQQAAQQPAPMNPTQGPPSNSPVSPPSLSSPPPTPGWPPSGSKSYYPPTYPPTFDRPSPEPQIANPVRKTSKIPFGQTPRPPLRPNQTTPDSYPRGPRALPTVGDSHHSPSEKVISLLVTSDSERYVTVDLSGVKTAAEMKELILNKLNIYNEDESNPYLFFQTEIGSLAHGDAVSDERLVALCHELGDAKGTLKFLVTQASAPVLEPPAPSRLAEYPPPSHPRVPIGPLRTTKRRTSRSRNGSVSSASEILTPEVGAGYEADVDNFDREGPRPSQIPPASASPPKPPSLPPSPPRRPSLPHQTRSGSPDQPTSPLPISERFKRKEDKHVLPPIPNSIPPPLSPHRSSFAPYDDPSAGTLNRHRHVRSGSDAAVEQEKVHRVNGYGYEGGNLMRNNHPYGQLRQQQSRDTLRSRKPQDEDDYGQEIVVPPGGRLLDELDPQSPRRRPYQNNSYVQQSQRPHSPYISRSHITQNPPRAPPPSVPSASSERSFNKARANLPISSNVMVSWSVGESARKQPPTTSGWKAGRLERPMTKSMNDMRNASQASGSSSSRRNQVPPTPQLPILSGSPHSYSPNSLSMSGMPGLPKSYDPSPKFIRPLPPKGLPPGNSPDVSSNQYNHRGYQSSLISPNYDPYPRPQSAAGETISPTRTNGYSSRLQSPTVYGSSLDPGENSRSPRTVSPNRSYHSPGFMTGPRPRPTTNSDRSEDLSSNPSGPENSNTPPLTPQDQQDERGYVDPSPPLSPRGIIDKDDNSGSELTLKEDDQKYYTNVLKTSNGTYIAPQTARPITRQCTPSPPPSRRDSTYSLDYGDEEYDSYIGGGTWIVEPKSSGKNASRPPLKVQIETPTTTTAERESPPELPQKDAAAPSTHSSSATAMNPDLLDPHFKRSESTSTETDSDTWELRPPPENIYDALEKFFPKNILDKPVIEANSGETSPTNAGPIPALPPMPVADDRSRIRAKKSIRIVAQEHKKRIDRTSKAVDMISQKDNMMRKRSTKLWGSRLEEVTNVQGRNNSSVSLPESPSGGPTTFKWVRGELIGKGTYGQVYMALNATTGEMIAVKQVELPQTASDKNSSRQHTVVQALKMESETLRDLDHPHIVQYLGFEETPANLSIFLEYVPGGSVGSCLHKHGKFADNVTRSFTAQILSGLEYLHSKGILHRDMKADNILVEMSGVCKISDFGISKRTEELGGGAFTAMQGTVFWMAPEVVNAQKKGYNFKIDIWSMGCVVLEMWAGMRPWMGEEMVAVMFKLYQSKQPPPVPEDVVLSEDADDFRRKCFAINPEERPSAAELRKHPYLILPPGWTFTGFT